MSSDQMEYTVRIYLTNGERLCYKSKVASEDVFNLGGGIENAWLYRGLVPAARHGQV